MRRIRLIILPERVFGSPGAHCRSKGKKRSKAREEEERTGGRGNKDVHVAPEGLGIANTSCQRPPMSVSLFMLAQFNEYARSSET